MRPLIVLPVLDVVPLLSPVRIRTVIRQTLPTLLRAGGDVRSSRWFRKQCSDPYEPSEASGRGWSGDRCGTSLESGY